MVTKGIVVELIEDKAIVRLPIFDGIEGTQNATGKNNLSKATVCTLPNATNILSVDDIVYVAFEDDDISKPVIIGHLKKEGLTKTTPSLKLGELSTSSTTNLSEYTSIGNITPTEIKMLKGVQKNIQLQIDNVRETYLPLLGGVIEGDLEVKGSLTLSQDLDITGELENLNVKGDAAVQGDTTLNTLNMKSKITVPNTSGKSDIEGSSYVSLGVSGNVKYVFENSQFRPAQTTITDYKSTLSLGTSAHKWKNLYLHGNISDGVNNLTVAQIASKAYSDNNKTSAINSAKAYTDTSINDAKAYTDTSIASIIGGATSALDTLKEVENWINNDETGAASLFNDVADIRNTYLPLSGGTMTGAINLQSGDSASDGKGINFTTGARIGSNSNGELGLYSKGTLYMRPNWNNNSYGLLLNQYRLAPSNNNEVDLGSSSLKFKDGYFSGTVTATTFSGNATSATTLNPIYVGNQNNNTSSVGWYKFLTVTKKYDYADKVFVLSINNTFDAPKNGNGILNIHCRWNTEDEISSCEVYWSNRYGFNEDIVIGVKNGTSIDFYIYIRTGNYMVYSITPLSILNRGTYNHTSYQFYNTPNIVPVTTKPEAFVTSVDNNIVKQATQDSDGNVIKNTYVNLAGTQTISGSKTFSASNYFTNNVYFDTAGTGNRIRIRNTANAYTDTLTNTVKTALYYTDKNAQAYGAIDCNKNKDGSTEIYFNALTYVGTASSGTTYNAGKWATDTAVNANNNYFGLKITSNGTATAYAPTPINNAKGKEVATTAWIATKLLNAIYPVGSVYISTKNTSPQSFLGGTWVQISGRFLLGAGANAANTVTTYGSLAASAINRAAGERGGEVSHTLTINEMPSHTHSSATHNTEWETGSYRGNGNLASSGSTGSTGGNGAHNNMPPYLVVYMWERTA